MPVRPPPRIHRRAALRALTAGLLLTCVAALLAGCAPRSEDTVIRFWAMGREAEVVTALVVEFERENPGIQVRVQQIPWPSAHAKPLTAFAADAMPIVLQFGNTWVPV